MYSTKHEYISHDFSVYYYNEWTIELLINNLQRMDTAVRMDKNLDQQIKMIKDIHLVFL